MTFIDANGNIDLLALSAKARTIKVRLVEGMVLPERYLREGSPLPLLFRMPSASTMGLYYRILGNIVRDKHMQHKGGFPRPVVWWSCGWEVVQHKLLEASLQELRVSRTLPGAKILVLLRPDRCPVESGDGTD